MAKFEELKTDYEIPEILQRDIYALREAVENDDNRFIDCLQDEIRGSSRALAEEQSNEIIDYYCRRRWL